MFAISFLLLYVVGILFVGLPIGAKSLKVVKTRRGNSSEPFGLWDYLLFPVTTIHDDWKELGSGQEKTAPDIFGMFMDMPVEKVDASAAENELLGAKYIACIAIFWPVRLVTIICFLVWNATLFIILPSLGRLLITALGRQILKIPGLVQ